MPLRGRALPLLATLALLAGPASLALISEPAAAEVVMKRVPQHLMMAEPGVAGIPPVESGPALTMRPLGTRATGTDVAIVLPIQFTNEAPAASHTPTYFENMMNAPSGQSVNAFYQQNSYGSFGIQATVSVWLSSSQTMEHYGADGSGVDDSTGPIYRLVTEAVNAANPTVDFTQFDEDSDGVVDHVVVVHAGAAQESSANPNTIWSHRWAVIDANPGVPGDQRLLADGVQIYGYIMISEDSPFGVVAHEFGHDLGLPDLYDTDGSTVGVGAWDVMGSGSWNGNPRGTSPAHFSAWSKNQLGWLTPIEVTAPLLSQPIPAVENSSVAYRLTVKDTSNGDEYFLVENRRPIGFDAELPGWGLLIWHVDDAVPNNDNDAHRLVDLEEADEAGGENPEEATDAWSASPQGFGPDSNPNSNGYGNVRTGWKVRNIGASGDVMTADLSREVDDDLAVLKLTALSAVPVNTPVVVAATIRNQGARDQSGVNATLRLFRDAFDPGSEVTVAGGTQLLSLSSGAFTNLTWTVTPTTAGRYIYDVRIGLPLDEIPENNERLGHFQAQAFFFRDDIEAGMALWTRPGWASDNLFQWTIVDNADSGGSSHSPTHAWRFGNQTVFLPNPLLPRYHYLDTVAVSVPGGEPLYLVYYQQYDLRGRETPVILNASDSDHAYVEVSIAGGPWQPVAHFFGWDLRWRAVSLNLSSYVPALGTTVSVRFNVSADVMLPAGGWWVDDVILLATNFSHGAALVPVVVQRTIEPGDEAVITFKAVNVGDFDDTFRFVVSLPQGWTAVMVTNSSSVLAVGSVRVPLAPDAEATLQLRLRSPAGILRGTVAEVPVVMVSQGDGTQSAEFTATVTIADPLGLGGFAKYLVWIVVAAIVLVVLVVIVDHLKSRKYRGYVR